MAVEREQLEVRVTDEGAVLDVDGTEVRLEAALDYDHVDGAVHDDLRPQVERTADGASWYFESPYQGVPSVSIVPVLSGDGAKSEVSEDG